MDKIKIKKFFVTTSFAYRFFQDKAVNLEIGKSW